MLLWLRKPEAPNDYDIKLQVVAPIRGKELWMTSELGDKSLLKQTWENYFPDLNNFHNTINNKIYVLIYYITQTLIFNKDKSWVLFLTGHNIGVL